MNKLTKVGCSALCGSLAAIASANAGDLSVTGGATLTYMSHSGSTTGNPFGMASAVSFSGTGELDNGWTYGFYVDETDTVAFSAARINITMGGLGTIEFDGGNSGNGIAAYDNVMPTAWEEAHGAGLSGGVKTVLGVGSSNNIQYTSPTIVGTTWNVTYAHDVGVSDTADKASKSSSDTTGRGYDVTVKINPSLGTEILSGLNLYGGGSVVEQYDNANALEDKYEIVGAVVYALGPIEIGAMVSGLYSGASETAATAYHTYKNQGFGVAFNVNDDFSVSYGKYESRKAGYNNSNAQATGENGRLVEVTSWQAAYTMGGASFKIADVKADNVLFVDAADQSATIVSMGLAF